MIQQIVGGNLEERPTTHCVLARYWNRTRAPGLRQNPLSCVFTVERSSGMKQVKSRWNDHFLLLVPHDMQDGWTCVTDATVSIAMQRMSWLSRPSGGNESLKALNDWSAN